MAARNYSKTKARRPAAQKSKTGETGNSAVYREVTDRMVAALERGVAPWRKPWVSAQGRPRSLSTGRAYQGVNTFLLGMTSLERGYTSQWWGTWHQVQSLGGQVRKGQNQANGCGATRVTLWKSYVPKDAEPDPETGKAREVVVARMIPLFNADQCEGLPEKHYPQPGKDAEPIARPQAVMDAYLKSGNAPALIQDEHGRAYYNPATDEIHMPPLAEHKSAESFHATAFHEISHGTGAASRLNRPGITELGNDGHGFASHPYGVEELAAEMGAAMLLAETGCDTEAVMENSASYLGSWVQTIKEDPKIVVSAASQAQRIADLVMQPTREAQADPEPVAEREVEDREAA